MSTDDDVYDDGFERGWDYRVISWVNTDPDEPETDNVTLKFTGSFTTVGIIAIY
jgi:hypothetical protein